MSCVETCLAFHTSAQISQLLMSFWKKRRSKSTYIEGYCNVFGLAFSFIVGSLCIGYTWDIHLLLLLCNEMIKMHCTLLQNTLMIQQHGRHLTDIFKWISSYLFLVFFQNSMSVSFLSNSKKTKKIKNKVNIGSCIGLAPNRRHSIA